MTVNISKYYRSKEKHKLVSGCLCPTSFNRVCNIIDWKDTFAACCFPVNYRRELHRVYCLVVTQPLTTITGSKAVPFPRISHSVKASRKEPQ